MDDQRLGATVRALRARRRWRQQDVADKARVSRTIVSRLERGHATTVTLDATRRICAALDARVELVLRWRGGELDRLLNAGHSAMHERMAIRFERMRDWIHAPEASFSIYGERGVIDILAWSASPRVLLVVELKTEIVDVQDLCASVDRYRRLAPRIAYKRGWDSALVGSWVAVADNRTNRRRLGEHVTMLRAAFPHDGRRVAKWLRNPSGPLSALSFLPEAPEASLRRGPSGRKRVRLPAPSTVAEPLAGNNARKSA